MLCMSGHARSVPEASVHPAVRLSLAACLVMRSSDSYHGSESKLPANAFNSLHSHSLSCRPCSLAVALYARFHGLAEVQSSLHAQARPNKSKLSTHKD